MQLNIILHYSLGGSWSMQKERKGFLSGSLKVGEAGQVNQEFRFTTNTRQFTIFPPSALLFPGQQTTPIFLLGERGPGGIRHEATRRSQETTWQNSFFSILFFGGEINACRKNSKIWKNYLGNKLMHAGK